MRIAGKVEPSKASEQLTDLFAQLLDTLVHPTLFAAAILNLDLASIIGLNL
jgi:hypothetical protein